MFGNFVVESAQAGAGTGPFALNGPAAETPYVGLVAARGTGSEWLIVAESTITKRWEVFKGTVTAGSPNTLSRDETIESWDGVSLSDSPINWSSGDGVVRIVAIAPAQFYDGLLSWHRGPDAPAWAVPGTIWIDDTGGDDALVFKQMKADGATWATLFTFNETTGAQSFAKAVNLAKGAGIALASTTDIWTPADGNAVHITGAGTVGSFGTAPAAGAQRTLIFDSQVTITAGTNVVTPGRKDITVAPGTVVDVFADTTAVMIVTPRPRIVVPAGVISGWTYSNNVGDAVSDIDIAAGAGTDGAGLYWMVGAALTKQLDASWAVGNNAGGLDTGSVANADYYIWAIARSDTGVVDYLFSLSATAPTMPANYDYKRRIGWLKRASGTIVPFSTMELSGGGVRFQWKTARLDVNLSNTLTTSRRTDTLSLPLDIAVMADILAVATDASAAQGAWVGCTEEADVAPSPTGSKLNNIWSAATGANAAQIRVKTLVGVVASRSTLSTVDTYSIETLGFEMSRR